MMTVVKEKQGAADPGSRTRTVPAAGPASGQKRLKTGSMFMPNVSEKRLVRMCAKEKNKLAKLRLLACIMRKRDYSIRKICRELAMPYSTVRDWLVRMQERGLRARFNRVRHGRKSRLPKSFLRTVRSWLKNRPKKYGFESGSWQLNLVLEMIRRRFGTDCRCKERTLRRMLKRIGFSYRKARPVPPKSASKSEQEEFKAAAGRRAKELVTEGYDVFVEDEAAVGMSQEPGYGWRPKGGRDEIQTGFSKKGVSLLGIMGTDTLYVRMADSANSETFKGFLGDVRKKHPKFYMVLDNASYHKSHTVREYVAGTGGDVEMEFLPPRTPQLNQIENVWRDLKKRLAGRYFKSTEELKAAITAILEKEMGNRLVGYLVN